MSKDPRFPPSGVIRELQSCGGELDGEGTYRGTNCRIRPITKYGRNFGGMGRCSSGDREEWPLEVTRPHCKIAQNFVCGANFLQTAVIWTNCFGQNATKAMSERVTRIFWDNS